jgi:hypothetical protein
MTSIFEHHSAFCFLRRAVFGSSNPKTEAYSQKYSTDMPALNARIAADLKICEILERFLTSYMSVLLLKV